MLQCKYMYIKPKVCMSVLNGCDGMSSPYCHHCVILTQKTQWNVYDVYNLNDMFVMNTSITPSGTQMIGSECPQRVSVTNLCKHRVKQKIYV